MAWLKKGPNISYRYYFSLSGCTKALHFLSFGDVDVTPHSRLALKSKSFAPIKFIIIKFHFKFNQSSAEHFYLLRFIRYKVRTPYNSLSGN